MSIWKDAFDLSLAFHCMRQMAPEKYRSVVFACRKSRLLRKHILNKTRRMMLGVLTKLEVRS